MDALRRALNSCGSWKETIEGTEVEARAGEFRFETIGGETIAYRIEVGAETLFGGFSGDVVVWRRRGILSIVQLAGLAPDREFLRTLVQRADSRITDRPLEPLPGPTT
jgi:hypothetical protein